MADTRYKENVTLEHKNIKKAQRSKFLGEVEKYNKLPANLKISNTDLSGCKKNLNHKFEHVDYVCGTLFA